MPKEKKPLIELTDAQKAYAKEHWKMDRRQLVQNTFANPNLTLRHVEAKSLEAYLISLGIGGDTPLAVGVPNASFVLSEDQQEYVRNTHETSNPLEMTRTLFNNHSLSLSSPEGRTVLNYCKVIAPAKYDRNNEPVEEMEYKPPRNLNEMVARVNKLVPNPEKLSEDLYDRGKLTSQEDKSLSQTLSWMNISRFVHQASQYIKKVDRELFESSFLGQVHDKVDLQREDVEQYIAYCASIVSSAQTDRTIQRLQAQADDEFETNGRVSMALVEYLGDLNTSLQDEKKRQESLYKTLTGARANRLDTLTAASSSMHPLVQAWRTKEGRQRLLAAAGRKRDALGKEVKRLTDTEAIRAEIWGLNPDSILL